ncbi:uncharacterized protein NKAPD1-like isoform X2 [Paramacrobiotus metropolitanus]|uniref:uncharacterized protein NKAPD1-like isoform X2 n=1 Tax=Paramacrobiotus metropolitanus TaxID=2943436 RepID=UPI0024462261|nr:uncharacterized protein NKAPD1-like isoform X2 [Paramacrobiotus metropolitanus]
MLHPSGKLLLRNSILNADAFNKSNEEQQMWQQQTTSEHLSDRCSERSPPSHPSIQHSKSRNDKPKSIHEQILVRKKRLPDSSNSNFASSSLDEVLRPQSDDRFWLRKLAECKEADPEKQLYPEELEPQGSRLSVSVASHKHRLHEDPRDGSHRKTKKRHRSAGETSRDRKSQKRSKKSKKRKKSKKEEG